ncbi:MAG TPA: acetyl-CoA C-acyltransferase [Frankiaceae bacterium]|jgi:acetyl-CoA acyltransferase|nr:acetyl-CoA C-acyltransferase [Frankiaceae bacterium]
MAQSRDAVIVDAVRTPVGKRRGSLASWHAADLSALMLRALAERNDLDPSVVDDVIWGCVQQVGQQGNNVGRMAVLGAGWPESVPATTIDRQCGSSQQSVHFAAAGLISGQYDVAVAGGVEIMSAIPIGSSSAVPEFGSPGGTFVDARYGVAFNQGIGAEMMVDKWRFSRAQLDEFSAASHDKLAAAIDDGRLAGQIVPVPVGDELFSVDEGLRRGTTAEKLAALKPAFRPDGSIHAGSSSQISDGAAALLMMTSDKARELGLTPLARVHTAVLAGDDPVMMLGAPIPATRKALQKANLRIDEIGAFEVNEAFAPVPMAWLVETGADEKVLNVNGGAIAIGHPLGASGARLMTALVHHMRDAGVRYGLQTMCEGGGMANATIVERLGT